MKWKRQIIMLGYHDDFFENTWKKNIETSQ